MLTVSGLRSKLRRTLARKGPAARAPLALDVPVLPTLSEAEGARDRFSGDDKHPVPACFVCGTMREEGDGLRIFPRPVVDGAWSPRHWIAVASLCEGNGRVDTEYLWAGLDCAGYSRSRIAWPSQHWAG